MRCGCIGELPEWIEYGDDRKMLTMGARWDAAAAYRVSVSKHYIERDRERDRYSESTTYMDTAIQWIAKTDIGKL